MSNSRSAVTTIRFDPTAMGTPDQRTTAIDRYADPTAAPQRLLAGKSEQE